MVPVDDTGTPVQTDEKKQAALGEYHNAMAQAENELYDKADAAGYERGFAKGQAEGGVVPEDTTPFDQAAMDKAVAEAKAEQAKVDDDILVKAKESMQSTIDDLGLKLKQKDADALEEAVADKLDALAKELRDRTVEVPQPPVEPTEPTEPAPVDPVPPVEEPETPPAV